MRQTSLRILWCAIGLALWGQPAAASMLEKTGTSNGLTVTYKVVLPTQYDPTRAYPTILMFGGGPQTLQVATNALDTDWRGEAERRGYIVISPAAPNGRLFFEDGDKIFPAFVDAMLRDYKVRDGKMIVAGFSNGGLSAFHIAALYPRYFTTVVGYPGLLDGPEAARLAVLKPMCVFMHVGDQDLSWMSAMLRQSDVMKKQGYKIQIAVERNQSHRLREQELNLSKRLYDEIERCK